MNPVTGQPILTLSDVGFIFGAMLVVPIVLALLSWWADR